MANEKQQGVQVNIKSLEQMETIVSKHKSLSWEGWNVVELIKNPTAMFKPNGVRFQGSWYIKNIFIVNQDGWSIPKKYAE